MGIDFILKLCGQLRNILQDVKEEEDNCNEGALIDSIYEEIMTIISYIEKERLLEIIDRIDKNGKN